MMARVSEGFKGLSTDKLGNFADQAVRSDDVLQYEPGNYWEKTSGNDVIKEFLGFLTSEDADRMQTLVDGGTIEITVNEKLTYSDFSQHNSEDFWTPEFVT